MTLLLALLAPSREQTYSYLIRHVGILTFCLFQVFSHLDKVKHIAKNNVVVVLNSIAERQVLNTSRVLLNVIVSRIPHSNLSTTCIFNASSSA